MCRGFPYGTSITCKKEGKIYVVGRILRSITMSRDSDGGETDALDEVSLSGKGTKKYSLSYHLNHLAVQRIGKISSSI